MQVLERMRGEPGASVGLSIERGGAEPFDVTLTRALIKLEPLWVSVEGSTGYIRIVSFEKDIHDRLGPAYDTLHDRLGERLNGLVLDLRNNPGGWQDQAVAVADDFLNDGVILTSHARWRDGVERFRANDGDITNSVPMVILINEGTASAAEIVASALQDNGRAVVMGRRSHGKGTMQSIYPMPYKTAIRLTTHRHYAPSGRSFDANGVVPDVAIIRERPDRATGTYDDTQVLSPAAVSEDRCPPGGAHVDRVLGCAIALVEAGSLEDFLAQFGR
jgi:carboxyl-terminal processing protease